MIDLIAELAAQSKWLHKAAAEIAAEGHAGWGNTCLQAAETIDAHAAEIEAMARDAERWRALCADCDADDCDGTPINIVSDACAMGSGALASHYDAAMRSAKKDGNG